MEPSLIVYRLSEFLERLFLERGIEANAFHWIDGPAMPLPYRDLLVHDRDMTSTLANFHGSELGLKVLNVHRQSGEYAREVILFAKTTGRAVEYGAIDMHFEHFRPDERDAILEGSEPLGSILNRMEHPYRSAPRGFFSIAAPEVCQEQFGCAEGAELFGRYNQLFSSKDKVLASIIEILPQ
ncbi:MAG: hypothetical protein CBD18_01870 [Opitutales bacterium TMED158]|nr:MAG: hypothetical protein CBD18_01870 [Opitutales bacterium TMED158]